MGEALDWCGEGRMVDFGASPMSYAVLDKQYVAVAAGSDIFSFALP